MADRTEKPGPEALAEFRKARLEAVAAPELVHPSPSQRAAAAEQLASGLESAFAGAGVDLAELESQRERLEAEMTADLEQLTADADAGAPSSLRASVATHVEALQQNLRQFTQGPLAAPGAGPFVLLGQPFGADYSGPDLTVGTQDLEPLHNVVRFRVYSKKKGASGSGDVSVGFLWENPFDHYSLVNLHGYIALNGYWKIHGYGYGIWDEIQSPSSHVTNLSVDAFLNIFWGDPAAPTIPALQADQRQTALDDSVDPGSTHEHKENSLHKAFDLSYSLLIVPPRTPLVFELGCSVNYGIDPQAGGWVDADFGVVNTDNDVICVGVLMQILT
jgi:hypothetical protein